MPLLVACPKCKQKLRVADDAVGKRIKCSSCGTVFAARASASPPRQERYGPKPEKVAVTRCTCPSCRTTLKLAAPAPAGKRIKCPRCATVFLVSGEETPVPAASRTGAPAGDEDASPRDRDRAAGTRRRAAPEEDIADKADQDYEEEPEERAPRRRPVGKGKQRKASLALRISALILGLIGGLFSGGLGLAWLAQASSPEVKAMRDFATAVAGETGSKELKENLARLDRMVRSSYFLLMAAPLGIAGGVLALLGRVKLGGALMLAAVPVPLILNIVTLMPLYFLLVGGLLALLTPSWLPGGGPPTVVVALLTAGGWVAVLVGWVVLILVLPKPAPEVKMGSRPSPIVPPVQRGGPGGWPGGEPGGPSGGQPARGKRVEVAMGIDGYPDVTKQGVRVGQTIKVKGSLYVDEGGRVSLSLARLYEGPEPAVSAVELTRAAAADKAAAEKKYQRPDGLTIVEGVVAELHPQSFSLSLEGAKD